MRNVCIYFLLVIAWSIVVLISSPIIAQLFYAYVRVINNL